MNVRYYRVYTKSQKIICSHGIMMSCVHKMITFENLITSLKKYTGWDFRDTIGNKLVAIVQESYKRICTRGLQMLKMLHNIIYANFKYVC